MRKHLHTAIVILLACLPCFGQFSEIWTNGDYFKVEQMASECYSASVERCIAVGVTPDAPSWWDYIVGKNHAKEVSVKNNIVACIPYYVNPRTNVMAMLTANDTASWMSSAQFLTDCGLASDAITETPYFKSQYPSTVGGWHSIHAMLTNLVLSESTYAATGTNWYFADGIGTNWSNAKFVAQSAWSNEFTDNFLPSIGSAGYYGYEALLANQSSYIGFSGLPTFRYKDSSVYSKITDFADPGFLSTFDQQGTSYTNGWNFIGNIGVNNDASNVGIFVGVLGNPPPYPTWCLEPNSVTNYIELGWIAQDAKVLHDWVATTNGFKYR